MNKKLVIRLNKSDIMPSILGIILVILSTMEIYIRLMNHSNAILIFLSLLVLIMETLIILVAINNGERLLDFPILLLALIFLFLVKNNSWSLIRNIGFFASLLLVVVINYYIRIAYFYVRISLIVYLIYALATIFLFLNPDIYFEYVVNLFPNTRNFLIKLYKSGYMSGITDHYSTNGMLIAVGLMIAFCLYLSQKEKWFLFLSIFMETTLLMTGKRAHVLFTAVALFIVYSISLSNSVNRSKRSLYLIGSLIIIITILYLIINYIPALAGSFSRMKMIISGEDDMSGRMILWYAAIDIFKNNKLFGIGWKQFPNMTHIISMNFSDLSYMDTHNIYLQILSEDGIIGFIVFIFFFIFCLITTFITSKKATIEALDHKDRTLLYFSLSYQIFFLLYGLTGNPLYESMMFIPYFMCCGIGLYYKRIIEYRGLFFKKSSYE